MAGGIKDIIKDKEKLKQITKAAFEAGNEHGYFII
jgi:hypothetical protein